MVILSSNEAITDLVGKRSSIYADRVSDKVVFTFRPSRKIAAPDTYDEVVRLKWHSGEFLSWPLIFKRCQDGGTRMGICVDALWCPMEGSPQAFQRGF